MPFTLSTKCNICKSFFRIIYATLEEHDKARRKTFLCNSCKQKISLAFSSYPGAYEPDYDPDCEDILASRPTKKPTNSDGSLKKHGYKEDGGLEFL